jgi:hypothetical protein
MQRIYDPDFTRYEFGQASRRPGWIIVRREVVRAVWWREGHAEITDFQPRWKAPRHVMPEHVNGYQPDIDLHHPRTQVGPGSRLSAA